MWAQQLIRPGQFELVEALTPTPAQLGPGEVLVRTRAGGLCGSDIPKFRGLKGAKTGDSNAARYWIPGFPLHEVVGDVVATRSDQVQVGDRVVGWATAADGLAEYIVTDGAQTHAFQSTADACAAVMIQPLACVLYALDRVSLSRASVAIMGLGPIGLLFATAARALGARGVIGVDPVDRSAEASTFGLDEVIVAQSDVWSKHLGRERPELVIEAVGHQTATLSHAVQAAAVGGTVLYFGIPDDDVYPIDMESLMRRNVALIGGITRERAHSLRRADEFLAAQPGLYSDLITHRFPGCDTQLAYEAAARPAVGRLKVILDLE